MSVKTVFLSSTGRDLRDCRDRAAAVEHARNGYERALCDGPPHCYKPALDEAKRLLEELDEKPPDMPTPAG